MQVHEDALAEYKTKVEEDMKEFEVQRKAEMERVKAAATEEEKKRIMVCFLLLILRWLIGKIGFRMIFQLQISELLVKTFLSLLFEFDGKLG